MPHGLIDKNVLERGEDMEQKQLEKPVKKAMKRDEAALETLLFHYQGYLYRMAYAYYKSEQPALDAVSECVAKVYLNLPKLRQPAYFKSWMTRILMNEVLDGGKKERGLVSLEELTEQGVTLKAEEEVLSREIKMDLYEALDRLSPQHRKVLILKYFNDMKIKDIAEIMELSPDSVKVMLHRKEKETENGIYGGNGI